MSRNWDIMTDFSRHKVTRQQKERRVGVRVGWGRGIGSEKEIKCHSLVLIQHNNVSTNRVMFPVMSPVARRVDEG